MTVFRSRHTLFRSKPRVKGIFPLPQTCFLCAIQGILAKMVCRGVEKPENRGLLLAIHSFRSKTLCRGKVPLENDRFPFAIHTFQIKTSCRDEVITDDWRRRVSGVLPAG